MTRLLQVVTFEDVEGSATVELPHNININGTQVAPDFVAMDVGGFSISVDAETVTVTNDGADPATINVWLERKHSTPRQLGGGVANLTPQPFIAAGGGSGGGTSLPVVVQDQAAFTATAGRLNYFTLASDTGEATFPAADSVPNGTLMGFAIDLDDNALDLTAAGGDTINGPAQLNGVTSAALFVSDGDATWICIGTFDI